MPDNRAVKERDAEKETEDAESVHNNYENNIMKKYLIALLFLLSIIISGCASNMSDHNDNYDYYRKTIDYIKNDSIAIEFLARYNEGSLNKESIRLCVSQKMYPPELAMVASHTVEKGINFELNGIRFNYNNNLFDSLYKYEQYLDYEPYMNYDLINISSDNTCNAMISFSRTYDNFLTAQLYYSDKYTNEHPQFGAFLNYLIIFKNDSIDKVITTFVNVN